MSKQKLTEWFPSNVKPIRTGVYETSKPNQYQYWNGKYWGLWCRSVDSAFLYRKDKSLEQNNPWRGLAVKP